MSPPRCRLIATVSINPSTTRLITARLRELPVPTLAAIEDLVFKVWEEQFGPLVEGYEALYRERLRPIAEALRYARP